MPATASNKLKAKTVAINDLSPSLVEDMWRLFHRYYDDVDRQRFEHDLAAKNHVIILRDTANLSLQGFSTMQIMRRRHQGRPFVAIYSGDTVISRGYWGQTALQRAFSLYTVKYMLRHPLTPVYWYLITKGYKTYLLLTRNYAEHWPRWEKATPSFQQGVVNMLSEEKFGTAWKRDLGVLQFEKQQGRLKSRVAPIDDDLLRYYKDIHFFSTRNPGHRRGDELCCLGRVNLAHIWCFTMRTLRKRLGLSPKSTVWRKTANT